jgi:hypothetical protein
VQILHLLRLRSVLLSLLFRANAEDLEEIGRQGSLPIKCMILGWRSAGQFGLAPASECVLRAWKKR